MKYLLLIPDGVGTRNFLCTRFIDLLLGSGDVLVWHALPERILRNLGPQWNGSIEWQPLPHFQESFAQRVLRQAKIFAQFYWRREGGTDVMLQQMRPSRWMNRLTGRIARAIGYLSAGASRIAWLDKLHALLSERATHITEFENLLRRERPDVVFCAHQRASRAVPAMLAARKLGIPTATFIYSWDNLPKGRMAVHADYFFVWSEFMKDELLTYYPDVSADRVKIVGTPQFEHYSNSSLIQPREKFLQSVGLDPARPVVCFSGDDVTTSPYDQIYLENVAEALRAVPIAQRPQILFRRCPVDASNRYQSVLEKYSEIAISDPVWTSNNGGDWTGFIPTLEDVALLVNVVNHSDVVVNVASTMAMDFAILDKPGIYLAYNPQVSEKRNGWNVHDLYRLPHFRSVHELQPVHWAYKAEDLAAAIMQVLSNPQEKSSARNLWLNKHAKHPLDRASERCYEALRQIA